MAFITLTSPLPCVVAHEEQTTAHNGLMDKGNTTENYPPSHSVHTFAYVIRSTLVKLFLNSNSVLMSKYRPIAGECIWIKIIIQINHTNKYITTKSPPHESHKSKISSTVMWVIFWGYGFLGHIWKFFKCHPEDLDRGAEESCRPKEQCWSKSPECVIIRCSRSWKRSMGLTPKGGVRWRWSRMWEY